MKKYRKSVISMMLMLVLLLSGCSITILDVSDSADSSIHSGRTDTKTASDNPGTAKNAASIPQIKDFDASSYDSYIIINDNIPEFSESEITDTSFEEYAPLDELGRCGAAYASIGTDLMPTEKRGNISMVKPTGWHSVRYDGVEGGSLYNRSHLIAYQLAGENANENNLITGTRYMNVGMIPFEEQVGDYVRDTDNHVMYRVTPFFEDDNLIASGVQMEALSVEDDGEGVSFNVFLYNVQPGIEIDYATGESREKTDDAGYEEEGSAYILNTNTMKFHLPSCGSTENIQKENRKEFRGDREKLLEEGYAPCGSCNP